MLPNPTLTAFAIGVALLIAALLAVTAGMRGKPSKCGNTMRIFTAGLAYVVVVVVEFTNHGMNTGLLILLAIASVLPVLAAAWAASAYFSAPASAGTGQGNGEPPVASRLGTGGSNLLQVTGILVALALMITQLVVAGRVLSLLGGIDARAGIAALGIVVALYVLSRGWRASSRTSRWSIFFVTLAVLVLVIGFLTGGAQSLSSPALPAAGYSIGHILGVLAATAAIGSVDLVLIRGLADSAGRRRNAVGGSAVLLAFVFAFGFGLLMIFGGSFAAPSESFFSLLAFTGAIGSAIVSGIIVLVLASTTDCLLAAASDMAADLHGRSGDIQVAQANPPHSQEDVRRASVAVLAVSAIIVSLFMPPISTVFILGAILAAATTGALVATRLTQTEQSAFPAALVGVFSGLVVAAIAGFNETLTFGDWTAVAVVVTLVVSGATGMIRIGADRLPLKAESPAPSESPV